MGYSREGLGAFTFGTTLPGATSSPFSVGATLGTLQSGVAAVKSIQSIISDASSFLGKTGLTDAQRQARADFFGHSAANGSVTSARYLIGGTQNTASHESPMYQQWINSLEQGTFGDLGATVMAEAEAQGAKWLAGVPDPGGTQQMYNDVLADLRAIGAPTTAAPAAPGSTAKPPAVNTDPTTPGGVRTLPLTTVSAGYNWTPAILLGTVVVGGFALAKVVRR